MRAFDEILENKLQRIASINYQVVEKAIVDDLNYGIRSGEKDISANGNYNSGIMISKTGKEIKEALQKEFALCVEHKVHCFAKMDELVKEIGFNPENSFKDDYVVNGWEGKIELPKKYCYEEIYKDGNEQNEKAKEMREYNERARKFIIASIEIKKLQTIINYIDEKKMFKLTVDLAAKLGF